MTNQLVSIHDGKVTASSLTVAEHFNKQHRIVMRSIRNLECSEEFGRCNFALTSYKTKQNKELPCYCITRDGFMFLVMGFTGKEAAMWKERFINAFNEMEEKLRQQEQSQSIIEHLRGKDMQMHIGYDNSLSFSVKERRSPYEGLAKAIADPHNIGLKDELILEIAQACLTALADRSSSRMKYANALKRKLSEVKPEFALR